MLDRIGVDSKKEPGVDRLLVRARRIIIAIGVTIAVFEGILHFDLYDINPNYQLAFELFGFAIFLPLLGISLLYYLNRSEKAHKQVIDTLDMHLMITNRLSRAEGWKELVRLIVEMPLLILPAEQVLFYLYKKNQKESELAAVWKSHPTEQDIPNHILMTGLCEVCEKSYLRADLHELSSENAVPQKKVYCLPLVSGERAIGFLRIIISGDYLVTQEQKNSLNEMVSMLSITADRAVMQSLVVDQAKAEASERQNIARDLHDTLGQNIAYLRLKLDALLLESVDPETQISTIRLELERMRDIADISYNQMRETLVDLQPGNQKDFVLSLSEHAQMVAERAQFKLHFSQIGTPVMLRPFARRQILYIFREGLANIEKHAHANQVYLSLVWHKDNLAITLTDDGPGFNPEEVDDSHHFGLSIMQERASSIHGHLQLNSVLGHGTSLVLELPLGQPQPSESSKINTREPVTVPIFIRQQESANCQDIQPDPLE
jgi:signal transduction histidine kinase